MAVFALSVISSLIIVVADNAMGDTTAEEWQSPYQYYSNDGGSVLRRQYGHHDTSPNIMHSLGHPGVAASLFFSSATVSVLHFFLKPHIQKDRLAVLTPFFAD